MFSEVLRGRSHFVVLDEADDALGRHAMAAVQLPERRTPDQLQISRHLLEVGQRLVDQTLAHVGHGKVELKTK